MNKWYEARTWSANSRISSERLLVCPAVVVLGLGGRVDISWCCPCCCCLAAVERTTLIPSRGLLHNCEIFAKLRISFVSSSSIHCTHYTWQSCSVTRGEDWGLQTLAVVTWSPLHCLLSQHQPDSPTPDWNTEISKLKYKILGITKNNLHDQGSVRWQTRTLHHSTTAQQLHQIWSINGNIDPVYT